MEKLNDILSKRTKKFGNILKSKYFWIFLFILNISYLSNLFLGFLETFPTIIQEIFLLLFYIVNIFFISSILFKFHKNRIYLFKYDEAPPWYSIKYIKKNTGTIAWTILIGTIFFIMTIILSFFI